MKKRAFTLIELIMVVVIIGILAGLSLAVYRPLRERALNREARANLRLIIAAERILRMETGNFCLPTTTPPCATIGDLNTNLKLALPTSADRNWNYSVALGTGMASLPANAQADRNNGDRHWCLSTADPDTNNFTCAGAP